MPNQFQQRLSLFSETQHLALLKSINRGIEKEGLRTDLEGKLSLTSHNQSLGSPLTHPSITTDFSESLMELITPVSDSIETSLAVLDDVHRWVYANLDDELFWPASMPCQLPIDSEIPVAEYGSSHIAMMKQVYRVGLGHRYGRTMQTIAGIHYNFSAPTAIWPLLKQQDQSDLSEQDYRTQAYFGMIRNFRRISWLLVYLFGASPALCRSFLRGREHQLDELVNHTLGKQESTSLRMGGLGYQSDAQSSLDICYNSLPSYVKTLKEAITTSYPDYESVGLKKDGAYQQLSTALLQIENEFYSPIRPKRVAQSGEVPIAALMRGGVEYIEVRCLDVNPYLPLGIDKTEIQFLDCFLLYCLFDDSPLCDKADWQRIDANFASIVNQGRTDDLRLMRRDGEVTMQAWAGDIMSGVNAIAELMDKAYGGSDYCDAIKAQELKLQNPELTPSAKVLADMQSQQKSHIGLMLELANQHKQDFISRPLSDEKLLNYQLQTQQSLEKKQLIEESCEGSFDDFLTAYYQQYDKVKP